MITVRLSEKEKAELEKHGKISDVVREAIKFYMSNEKAVNALKKMEEYQKNKKHRTMSSDEIVTMIREDRESH